jgi:hypothetical protein
MPTPIQDEDRIRTIKFFDNVYSVSNKNVSSTEPTKPVYNQNGRPS